MHRVSFSETNFAKRFLKVTTFFDVITVTGFAALVLGFFQFTDRETRTLIHFVLVGIVLAVANQVGNAGAPIWALILIAAGGGARSLHVRVLPADGPADPHGPMLIVEVKSGRAVSSRPSR